MRLLRVVERRLEHMPVENYSALVQMQSARLQSLVLRAVLERRYPNSLHPELLSHG